MLGNLQQDMDKQGIKTTAKGMCHACEKPIVGQVVTAVGKTWHPEVSCQDHHAPDRELIEIIACFSISCAIIAKQSLAPGPFLREMVDAIAKKTTTSCSHLGVASVRKPSWIVASQL